MDARRTFSSDYATARARFRQAASTLDWQLEDHRIDPLGPNRETLAIDVALTPPGNLDCCLVLSSGLHGVEGFLGSAIQIALLNQWADRPEALPRVRLVFLHTLNPYGFAWLRRCDEKNVDVNRNFQDNGYGYSGSPPGYADLDRLLNPKRPPSKWGAFSLKALLEIARHGMPALKQATAAGQYDYPQGLFYGGSEASSTNEILSEHMDLWLAGCRRVVHLDIHTGLGRWATPTLLVDSPLADGERKWLEDWFGEDSLSQCDASGVAYAVRGSLGQWCVRLDPERRYLFAGVEVGTYSPLKVLSGLRTENQAYHWGKPDDTSALRAKQRLKELFCPKSNNWRQPALSRCLQLVYQAISGLTFEAESQPESSLLVRR